MGNPGKSEIRNQKSAISWLWDGATFTPCDSLPLTDRGFRYGMSVFESIRVWKNTPLYFAAHAERLRHACERCGFQIDDTALASAEKLLRENGDGFARIYVTAGDGPTVAQASSLSPTAGFQPVVANNRIAVFIEPREIVSLEIHAHGYALALSPEPHRPLFGGLKTANYWANAHALGLARARRCDEALLFNSAGELISACMANVFVVCGGKIATSSLEAGARDGVIRAWICERREVEQRALTRADLAHADEIFLTNSWLGVMPVASLEDRPLESKLVATSLRVDYERALQNQST